MSDSKMRKVDEVRYSKAAQKFIRSRNEADRQKIKNVIECNLKIFPASGDIKLMKGYSDQRKRLRVGSIRIIFKYDEEGKLLILLILDIGNRGDVYK